MGTMQLSEIWNKLLGHVIQFAPWAEDRLEEVRKRTWYLPSPETAQLNLLMVCLDLDLDDFRHRSKAKHLLEELFSSDVSQIDAKTPMFSGQIAKLPQKHVDRLLQSVKWAFEAPFEEFEQLPVDQAVILVRKSAPSLKGFRAHRWLNSLGYHVATPDLPRQRFLFRMGWLKEVSTAEAGKKAAFKEIQKLSVAVEAPLREIDYVLGLFAGAIEDSGTGVARCLAQPLCEECPIASECLFFRIQGSDKDRGSGALADTMRTEDLPKERIRKEGPEHLSSAELLSVLLRPGQSVPNTLQLAHRLLRHAGSLRRLSEMSFSGLSEIPGVGSANAAILMSTLELCRKFNEEDYFGVGQHFTKAEAVFTHFRSRFLGAKQEEIYVINLDSQLKVIRIVPVSKGLLLQAQVESREIFKEAIKDSAHSMIIVHNHPSGSPKPSKADRRITEHLYRAGEFLRIPIQDHIIIGEKEYYSFAEEGTLEPSEDFS